MKTMHAVMILLASGLSAGTAAAQSGDAAQGERVFNQQCKICHTVDKDGKSLVGPNLSGLFGSKAGSAKGFAHSEAMTKSGIVWDDKTLVEYLKDPKGRVPGTKMVYAGLKRQEQLDDVIAYLKKATQ
jgi:cytochrome c